MRVAWLVFAASLGVVVALAGACTYDGKPCYGGDWRHCTCASGAGGYQQCAADAQGYGACDCSGAVPGVAGSTGAASDAAPRDAAGEAAGLLPFMSPCSSDAECVTDLCFNFNAKGPRCTKPCTQAADCPPPSTGCSNMGVCKSP